MRTLRTLIEHLASMSFAFALLTYLLYEAVRDRSERPRLQEPTDEPIEL